LAKPNRIYYNKPQKRDPILERLAVNFADKNYQQPEFIKNNEA